MTTANPDKNKAHQAAYRQRQRQQGNRSCVVLAPKRWHDIFRQLASAVREHENLPATEFLVYWRDEHGRLHPLKELPS